MTNRQPVITLSEPFQKPGGPDYFVEVFCSLLGSPKLQQGTFAVGGVNEKQAMVLALKMLHDLLSDTRQWMRPPRTDFPEDEDM